MINKKSLTNLKPAKPGEIRNPKGINRGRTLFRTAEFIRLRKTKKTEVQKVKEPEVLLAAIRVEPTAGMKISLVEFKNEHVSPVKSIRFTPIIEALKKSLDDGKVVRVDFGTEIEAIQAHKWALTFGEHRSDPSALRRKQEHGFCITSRSRAGCTLFLWAKKI